MPNGAVRAAWRRRLSKSWPESTKAALICTCDAEKSDDIVATYKVRNIPTLVFLKDGQEVARIVGATTKAEIVDKLSKLL